VIGAGQSDSINATYDQIVTFTGGTGSLVLNNPASFTGQIVGFTGTAPDAMHSDAVDLVGIDYASDNFAETYNASTGLLTVTDGTHAASITFDDFNGTLDFASDNNGGTLVTDPPKAGSSGGSTAAPTVDDAHSEHGLHLGEDDFNFGSVPAASQPGGVTAVDGHDKGSNHSPVVSIGGAGNDNFVFHSNLGAGGTIFNSSAEPAAFEHTDVQSSHAPVVPSTPEMPLELPFDPVHNDGSLLAAQFHQIVASATHLH
jgi:hypothetical protein